MIKNIMNGGSLKSLMLRQADNEDGADDTEAMDFSGLREAFKEERGRAINVSDAILEMAVNNITAQWTAWNEEGDSKAIFDFIEKVETASKSVAITDPGISALAAKLNEDDAFNEELIACVDAIMKNKTTAVDMYAQLHRVLTKDELDGMPMIGTEEKDVVGTNYRPDKVKTRDKVTGVELTVTWSNDMVSSLSHVKAWEKELDEVTKELKTSGSVKRFANTSKAELLALKSELTGKRNGVRSMFKRAVNLHHNFEAVNAMPLVVIEWIPGTKKSGILIPSKFGAGTVTEKTGFYASKSPKPLWIYPKGSGSKGKEFSVTQLINFDVAKALKGEGNGTMGDLIATLSKGPDDASNGEGDGSKMSAEDYILAQQRTVSFLNVKDNQAAYRKMLADKKRDDRKDLLETLRSEYLLIAPIYRMYEKEIEAMDAADQAKTEQMENLKRQMNAK